MISPGTELGQRYRLEERIASGGMGDVWRCVDTVLGRTVAVKLLLSSLLDEPGFTERFRGEARTMATISHPGVVDVYDYGSDPNTGAYLVMEYIQGDALSRTLARVGRLTAGRTMALSGLVLAAFIVFHILHLTTGTVQPAPFADLRPYDNMVNSFRVIPVAGFYVLSVCLLGLHLYHGAWSMFQSVGFNHPRYTPALRRFAAVFAFLLAIGFSVVPIAVLTGMVR